MEQMKGQIDAGDVVLDDAILDRIDAIVPPGTNLNSADGGYTPPALERSWERRRPSRR